MSWMQISRPAAVLASVVGLSACGGGGGAESVGTADWPARSMLGISASNYQAVAQSTVSSALYLGSTGDLVGGDARLMSVAMGTSRRALSAGRVQPELQNRLATLSDTLPCSQGGRLLLSVNDANNNGNFDVGDSITMDAQACKEEGTVTQGRIALSVQALSGVYDSNNFSATLAMTLTGFSATTGNDSMQGDGTLTLTVSETPAGIGELALATPLLVLGGRIDNQTFSTVLTDTRLTVRSETVGSTTRTSITYASGLSGSQFGSKEVSITTPQALVITGSDSYPSSGQLVVHGHANSALRITALNATQARLELDAEGDGSYETQVVKTWAELE